MPVDQTHLMGVLRDWEVQTINQEVPLDQIGLMAREGNTSLLKEQMDLQEAQDQEIQDCPEIRDFPGIRDFPETPAGNPGFPGNPRFLDF